MEPLLTSLPAARRGLCGPEPRSRFGPRRAGRLRPFRCLSDV